MNYFYDTENLRMWHTGPCILPVFSIPAASVRIQKVTIRILKRLTNVAFKHVIGGMASRRREPAKIRNWRWRESRQIVSYYDVVTS